MSRPAEWVSVPVDEPATLRDRFAMAALAGLLGGGWVPQDTDDQAVMRAAFAIADGMLTERVRPKEPACTCGAQRVQVPRLGIDAHAADCPAAREARP